MLKRRRSYLDDNSLLVFDCFTVTIHNNLFSHNPCRYPFGEKYGVMTRREIKSRHEIFLEEYEKKVRIEGNAAVDIAKTMILPAVRAEYLEAAKAYNETDSSNVKVAIDMLHGQMAELGNGLVKMNEGITRLQDALDNFDTMDILARMAELRKIADALETVVSNDKWPLPKYREMLFLY